MPLRLDGCGAQRRNPLMRRTRPPSRRLPISFCSFDNLELRITAFIPTPLAGHLTAILEQAVMPGTGEGEADVMPNRRCGERASACEMHHAFLTLMYAFPLLPGEGAAAEEDKEDEDVIFPLSPRV
jgi:hypothetical protein